MVKNLPCNARDRHCSILARGTKITHAAGQHSSQAMTTKPEHSEAHAP